MRTVLALCALTACASSLADAGPDTNAIALSDDMILLSPIQIDSLTLTPIVAVSPKKAPDFIVLDEGMANDVVMISEAPQENVNELIIVNLSDSDLFLLAGEVIIGGKQDRIIGRNTVIPSNTKQTVPVFCVEHGRWDNSGVGFRSARALAHGRLRGQASYADQQEVWNEVAIKNNQRNTNSATNTYRTIASQQSDGTLAKQRTQLAAALAKVPASVRKRMVGYAVAINGQVATIDMFGSAALFRKLEDKLVKSYITEAIDVVPVANLRPPTKQAVKAFMLDADNVSEQKSYATKKAKTSVQSGSNANKSNVYVGDDNMYRNYQANPRAQLR